MIKHTPGPWRWEVTQGGEVRLATPDRGKLYVMGFERKGMRGAQPTFSLWGEGQRERRGGIMNGFVEAGGETHPDARLIAAAPELLAALKAAMRFIDAHVADPDITNEMCQAWEALQRLDPRAAIAKAEGGQDEQL